MTYTTSYELFCVKCETYYFIPDYVQIFYCPNCCQEYYIKNTNRETDNSMIDNNVTMDIDDDINSDDINDIKSVLSEFNIPEIPEVYLIKKPILKNKYKIKGKIVSKIFISDTINDYIFLKCPECKNYTWLIHPYFVIIKCKNCGNIFKIRVLSEYDKEYTKCAKKVENYKLRLRQLEAERCNNFNVSTVSGAVNFRRNNSIIYGNSSGMVVDV